jgi:hypothetical protein
MTQALANVQYRPQEIDTEKLGAIFVKSGFFQDTRDAAQAIVKILAGAELGFGPLASMQGVYIVKGRVTLSANLVGAAIQRSGKYAYRVLHLDDSLCELVFLEGGQEIGHSIFTMKDAQTAGLATETYNKFPRNMLFSRALTNGARWYCPEIFNGAIYTPDEIMGASVEREGRVVDITTGEVLEEAAYVPTREREPEAHVPDRMDLALEQWAEVCAEADRLKISHKPLPANPAVDQVERWTIALNQRVTEATIREQHLEEVEAF